MSSQKRVNPLHVYRSNPDYLAIEALQGNLQRAAFHQAYYAVANLAKDELFARYQGRFVRRRELPDGSAVLDVGMDENMVVRDARGFVYMPTTDYRAGQRMTFNLFATAFAVRPYGHNQDTGIIAASLRRAAETHATTLPPAQRAAFERLEARCDKTPVAHAFRLGAKLFFPLTPLDRVKAFTKQVFGLLDPALVRLLMQVSHGKDRTTVAYNRLVALQNPHQVPPTILALYLNLPTIFVRAWDPEQRIVGDPDRDLQQYRIYDRCEEQSDYPRLDHVEVTRLVQASLTQVGETMGPALSRSMWRYLTQATPKVAGMLMQAQNSRQLQFNLQLLEVLAETGEQLRFKLVQHVRDGFNRALGGPNPGVQRAAEMPHRRQRFVQYTRMWARYARSTRGYTKALRPNYGPILDWLMLSDRELTPAQAALPLAWWQRQSEAWHEVRMATFRRQAPGSDQEWLRRRELEAFLAPLKARQIEEREAELEKLGGIPYALADQLVGHIQVRALASKKALETEGRQMSHCVGGYFNQVLEGSSRIFALRDSQQERSTLELRWDRFNQQWVIGQHHGVRNGNISKAHEKVGREILRQYREVQPGRHAHPLQALLARHERELNERSAHFVPAAPAQRLVPA
jgi:hypothetical protein